MKQHFAKALMAVLIVLALSACEEPETIEFKGKVVGARYCSSVLTDNNPGMVVQLTEPQGYGGTLTSDNGQQMSNVIVLYETFYGCMVDDQIHGRMYRDDKYSKLNCSLRWDIVLPECVCTELHVD